VTTQVLALSSYHGGSHRAQLEGWQRHSRHEFTVLTLPAYKWKWRMRHAAVTFAEQVAELVREGHRWDILFCTDMLNLAEFLGLCPSQVARLPRIAYFHENQLTYPRRRDDQRDLHFAFTNLTTALAGDRVWFNSAFHRDTFLHALTELLKRMPDFRPLGAVEEIRSKSAVRYPGIDPFPPREFRKPGPLRILWASRWEHDKDPDCFFRALYRLHQQDCPFRLSVLGESFGDVLLQAADVVVSTAQHEFFGIAAVEAASAGCYPVLPARLAYPEVFGNNPDWLYDGTETGLVQRLLDLSALATRGLPASEARRLRSHLAGFVWPVAAKRFDDAVDELVETA
jgi:glycosyltransferase involved in cell wall biosynthesis